MTKVIHNLGESTISSETKNASFFLTNKRGGFAYFPEHQNDTKYQGVFFFNGKLYKIIEEISLEEVQPEEIRNNFYNVQRVSGNITETFFMNSHDAFIYTVENHKGNARVILDMRGVYDFSDQGRIYNIEEEQDSIIITYDKFTDDTLSTKQYSLYLIIKGVDDYELINDWIKKSYPADSRRNSNPGELYVYHALNLKLNGHDKIVFSYGDNLNRLKKEADHLYKNSSSLERSKRSYIHSLTKTSLVLPKEVRMAYSCCINSLDALFVESKYLQGLYAGLPWFFQIWTRDENISLNSFILEGNYELVKKRIREYSKLLLEDGRIRNRYPSSELASADGVGWFFARVHDFISTLQKEGLLNKYFTQQELNNLKIVLEKSIFNLLKCHSDEGLITNNPSETWMETALSGGNRSGKRIEIQALTLKMYNLINLLSSLTRDEKRKSIYTELELLTRDRVKQVFYEKGELSDGENDKTIRPNIFLAYYLYPHLLSNKEWESAFDNTLPSLWNTWGGLSSLDKTSPNYVPRYTGEDDKSYHRGDSWYWINNLAALCMNDLNKKKYEDYIQKILGSSTHEILFSGAIGHHAEVSSSQEQSSDGCLAQAWSAATYIELVNSIFKT